MQHEVINGLARKALEDAKNLFTPEEYRVILLVTELLIEAELRDRAGLRGEHTLLASILKDWQVVGQLRAGVLVKDVLVQGLTAVLGFLGTLVLGML